MSAYFSDHEVPWHLGSSNLAGKHEGRGSRLSGSHGPGGGRCDLHRRTTGRWSPLGRKLAIGDVVRAISGDTSALHCRSGGLRADFTLAAPADELRGLLAEMGVWPAPSKACCGRHVECWHVGWRHGRNQRTRGQLEFRDGQLNRA